LSNPDFNSYFIVNPDRIQKKNGLVIHCVSKKHTDVAHYNFNEHKPILVIFGRGIVE